MTVGGPLSVDGGASLVQQPPPWWTQGRAVESVSLVSAWDLEGREPRRAPAWKPRHQLKFGGQLFHCCVFTALVWGTRCSRFLFKNCSSVPRRNHCVLIPNRLPEPVTCRQRATWCTAS